MPGMPGMEQKQEAKPPAQSPRAKPKAADAHQHASHDMQNMSGMDMSKNEELPTHLMSGTHLEPASIPAPMWMKHIGPWMLMAHGNLFLTGNFQGGPRGLDRFESTNWLMLMEHRNLMVVGDDAQCLVEGTLVTMADGTQRPIEEVSAGDAVLSGYGSGDFRPARVLRVHRSERSDGIAITTQSGRRIVSTPDHVHFAGVTHSAAVRLAELLLTRAPWSDGRVFYSDNGSTAVEVALKMAYQFWCHQGEPQRTLFIGFENGYHGDTFGAMAASRDPVFFGRFEPLLFRTEIIPMSAERLDETLTRHRGQVAAVIIEPLVQGAGGMRMHSPEVLRELMFRWGPRFQRHRWTW